jgi:hypothetical protein
MSPYMATKQIIERFSKENELGLDVSKHVFRGGQDPGGWTRKESLVCIIHEGTDIPNEYNHRDPLGWWVRLGDEVSALSGKKVYFEWINSCVAAAYPA